VDGASVAATLVETRKGEKVKIFKKIRRQGYRRTRGHRQAETVLRVTGITAGGKETKWDGTVDMTTKAELDARARGLDFATLNVPKKARTAQEETPLAKALKAPAKKAAAPKAEVVEEAAAAAQVNAPVEAEAPAKTEAKKAAPPKEAKAKAAAPKAEGEAKKPAAKKAAKKDDAAE